MAAIYSNGGNRWNILGFNFTKRDALSSVYKISIQPTFKMLSFYPFFQQMGDGNKFKRTQSWRKILKKKDKKMKEREEGKLDGANSGSD
jgi:hypothetical protein